MAEQDKPKMRDALGRLTEAGLRAKYPHVVEGSLRWDTEANKQVVDIVCVDCGATRATYTSDLFQINRCDECREKARKARKAEKKAAVRAALAAAAEAKKAEVTA